MSISEVMSRDVHSIALGSSLADAAAKMRDGDIGSLPVTDDGRICGIVTDRDIVVRGIADGAASDSKVDSVMTRDVHTVASDCSVEQAAQMMAERQIRRLYVVDGDTIKGVVALGDLAVDPQGEKAGEALTAISRSPATVA